MKKLLIALTTSLALAGAGVAYAGHNPHSDHECEGARAAQNGGHAKGSHRGMHFFENKLDLTDDQKQKIHAIFDANRDEKTRPNPGAGLMSLDPSAKDYDAQVQRLAKEQAAKVEQGIVQRGKVHAQVYAVLTPTQREKMASLMKEKQERMQKRQENMHKKMDLEAAPK